MQPHPSLKFRPDVDRAIYICGEICPESCAALIPKIHELRKSPSEAITVFINSPGGDIPILDTIIGLLKSPDFDGHSPRIITVASGEAASAAAMMLAMGDYAIAYPHSIVHFHGVRYGEIRNLTTEYASSVAKDLEASNREIAFQVAHEVIRRLTHRISYVKDEFQNIRSNLGRDDATDLECFVEALKGRISTRAHRTAASIVEDSIFVKKMGDSTVGKLKPSKNPQSSMSVDLKVLKSLIDYERKTRFRGYDSLDEFAVEQLLSDYLLLRDYFFGEHRSSLMRICNAYGALVLDDNEAIQYDKVTTQREKSAFMQRVIRPRMWPLWYFTSRLCRRLHRGENRFSATDAYWLGLVDEVIGTHMTGYRLLFEDGSLDADVPEEAAADQE